MHSPKTCETCRFWTAPKSGKDYDFGLCHRFPPTWRTTAPFTAPISWFSAFAETFHDSWCGCWLQRGTDSPKKKRSAKQETVES
jgi:hypothetical protein